MKSVNAITTKIKNQSFAFVLDELTELPVRTRAMFGCTAVYVEEKIVLVFCDRPQLTEDRGIWVCIPSQYCREMKADFPTLRGVSFFENENSAWQCLPQDDPNFEETALQVCALIRKRDPRIGRTPKPKRIRGRKK